MKFDGDVVKFSDSELRELHDCIEELTRFYNVHGKRLKYEDTALRCGALKYSDAVDAMKLMKEIIRKENTLVSFVKALLVGSGMY